MTCMVFQLAQTDIQLMLAAILLLSVGHLARMYLYGVSGKCRAAMQIVHVTASLACGRNLILQNDWQAKFQSSPKGCHV